MVSKWVSNDILKQYSYPRWIGIYMHMVIDMIFFLTLFNGDFSIYCNT